MKQVKAGGGKTRRENTDSSMMSKKSSGGKKDLACGGKVKGYAKGGAVSVTSTSGVCRGMGAAKRGGNYTA